MDMPHRRTATEDMIKQVLGDDYLVLHVDRYKIEEDVVGEGACTVTATLRHESDSSKKMKIEGNGVGFIDALYHGMMAHYAKEFPSLETIQFTGFTVSAKMETSQQKGADAEGLVALTVKNSEGTDFLFEHTGRSIVTSAIEVVVEALEYFVNSERAFLSVHNALKDAKGRSRADLVQGYTKQLSELVKTTSYSSVIERAKSETL